LIQHNITWIL